jgi:CheY-like chemotaxis protein
MIKVLFLVDDDHEDREIFKEALSACDRSIEFLFAGDGIEALATLDSLKNMPDVIFVDHYMPRMNGLECLKALKLNSKTKSIPMVVYSTSADGEKDTLMLSSGADYYLRKHSTFADLCSDLKAMLEVLTIRSA